MSKLGWFASYLRLTSAFGVIGWGLTLLVSLSPQTEIINTFASGTPLGYLSAVINLCFYPLQIGLGFLLCVLLNISSATRIYSLVVAASFLLLAIGYGLQILDEKRTKAKFA